MSPARGSGSNLRCWRGSRWRVASSRSMSAWRGGRRGAGTALNHDPLFRSSLNLRYRRPRVLISLSRPQVCPEMNESGPAREKKDRPPGGLVSSPRAYFGRASRAASGASRGAVGEIPEPAATKRPLVYHAGDPALRLFAGFAFPLPPRASLTGVIATLSGLRDGA